MIIVIITIFICLIIFLYNVYHNKFIFLNIKISSIEEKINSTLIKRKELIKESEKLIKDILGTKKKIFESFNDKTFSNLSMIEQDEKLSTCVNEFYLIKDKYKKLQNNETLSKISFSITETDDLLESYKLYYNNVIKKYNKLLKKFPINLFNIIKRKKQKELF